MNLAELGAVLTVLSSGISGCLAAHQHGAGFLALLFGIAGGVVGLLLGLAIAFLTGRLAFAALARSSRPTPEGGHSVSILFTGLYILIPLASIVAGVVAPLLLAGAILPQPK